MNPVTAFKSYDLRGTLGVELNEDIVRDFGRAFARVMQPGSVVTGRDARESSPRLQAALIDGLRAEGVDVIDIGLCGTEEVYFATDHYGAGGGLMVTASHNPIGDNGIKLVGKGARPISGEEGLNAMRDLVAKGDFGPATGKGGHDRRDPRAAYVNRVLSFLGQGKMAPLHVLVNPGNGAAGPTFDVIAEGLAQRGAPIRFTQVNGDPDPTFPNGIPNPLLAENRVQTSNPVRAFGADFGVAWDGDFDRCFFFDETGAFIDGEYVVALLAKAFMQVEPGARIVHDPRVMWNTVDVVTRGGGTPVVSKTGHAHLKAKMREVDAAYGGEMSAHHYFRRFMYCDSGMIPLVLVAGLVARSGRSLSAHVAEMKAAYPSSGEINFHLSDVDSAIARFEACYVPDAQSDDRLDGISLDMGTWRANLRRSNTEAVLRLNIESRGDAGLVARRVAEVSALLQSE